MTATKQKHDLSDVQFLADQTRAAATQVDLVSKQLISSLRSMRMHTSCNIVEDDVKENEMTPDEAHEELRSLASDAASLLTLLTKAEQIAKRLG